MERERSFANIDEAPVADVSLAPGASVPVIDLSEGDASVVEAVGRACADWGFFQIVGHRVDPGVTEAAMAETRAFFALPMAAKRALSRSRDNPWGFYDRELTKNVRDKKEIFDIGPESVPGDPFAGRTPWPAERPAFEPAMRAFFTACESLAACLTDLVSRSLGAAPDELGGAFAPTHTSFLRLNHYPVEDPLGAEADGGAGLGIHHHTDAGAVTVLLQDRMSGLQVYRDGAWHTVIPLDGAFVVNIGDMVQVWSNDLYRAPIHRVLAMDTAERYSLPFFYNPGYEARIAPLAILLGGAQAPHYVPIPWGEFRRRRADGDFADYGSEVQISDYRC